MNENESKNVRTIFCPLYKIFVIAEKFCKDCSNWNGAKCLMPKNKMPRMGMQLFLSKRLRQGRRDRGRDGAPIWEKWPGIRGGQQDVFPNPDKGPDYGLAGSMKEEYEPPEDKDETEDDNPPDHKNTDLTDFPVEQDIVAAGIEQDLIGMETIEQTEIQLLPAPVNDPVNLLPELSPVKDPISSPVIELLDVLPDPDDPSGNVGKT